MTGDLASGPMALLISEFAAGFMRCRNGAVQFDIETRFMDADQAQVPTILGVLGGAAVEIAIGADAGTSLPCDI